MWIFDEENCINEKFLWAGDGTGVGFLRKGHFHEIDIILLSPHRSADDFFRSIAWHRIVMPMRNSKDQGTWYPAKVIILLLR